MSNIISLREFSPKPADQYFFDNNVWMFLYCPLGNYARDKQEKYAQILERIRNVKSNIFLNSLVLSEFSNAWIKKAFDSWSEGKFKPHSAFKSEFVGSKEYCDAVDLIAAAIRQISSITQRGNDDFNSISLEDVFTNYKFCDFNDSYYLELARKKNWIIVSDDADLFQKNKHSIKVVTARNIQ